MLKVNMKVAIEIKKQLIPVYEIDYPFVIEKDVDYIISTVLLKGAFVKLSCVEKVLIELGKRLQERLENVQYDELHLSIVAPTIEALDYEYYLKRLFKRKDYSMIEKLMKITKHPLTAFDIQSFNKQLAKELNYKIKGE